MCSTALPNTHILNRIAQYTAMPNINSRVQSQCPLQINVFSRTAQYILLCSTTMRNINWYVRPNCPIRINVFNWTAQYELTCSTALPNQVCHPLYMQPRSGDTWGSHSSAGNSSSLPGYDTEQHFLTIRRTIPPLSSCCKRSKRINYSAQIYQSAWCHGPTD
jgi:hypothetical protein